jgi:short-subunit dehydrogenase
MTVMVPYRSALVTGASSGIGEEFARQLAARRTDLVLVARRRERLEALATELAGRHGVDVEVMVADLTDAADLRRVERRIEDPVAIVELVINNAGRGIEQALSASDRDDEERCAQLNVLAVLRLSHAALAAMVPRGRGGILNVSSIACDIPNPGAPTYAAAKAFVTTLGQGIHYEAKTHGVHVTTLLPGFVKTEIISVGTHASVPSYGWVDVSALVAEAIRDVETNKVLSVPTLKYKVVTQILQLLPRSVVRLVSSRVDLGTPE